MAEILIIDDDVMICKLLEKHLSDPKFNVKSAYSAAAARKQMRRQEFDVVVCDFRLPDSDGFKMLEYIRNANASGRTIIITAYPDVNAAVRLIQSGADDYLVKPFDKDKFIKLIENLSAVGNTTEQAEEQPPLDFYFGNSREMQLVLEHAETVAPTNLNVVISGETGSGKEYLARYLHYKSSRRHQPFVALDCGAIPKTLANSELFGHVKGSFTGAVADKVGVFQEADGGTLFLDEIGNLDYEIQVKLLRTLQGRKMTRVGETGSVKIDVRIITASNDDLGKRVRKNKFREDLYYRLNEFSIRIPPLRERGEDIMAYAHYFMKLANKELNRQVNGFGPDAVKIVNNYPWYGNLRELRNIIKRSVLLTKGGKILIDVFPPEISSFHLHEDPAGHPLPSDNDLQGTSMEAERKLIVETLRKVDNNKSKAARILKIDRKTLYNKMKRLDIDLRSI